jgi:hypothetical protein
MIVNLNDGRSGQRGRRLMDQNVSGSAVSTIVPRIFDFNGMEVRVFDRVGDPWWVLSDVCQPLGIANPRDAASRLDVDEKGVVTTDTPGGPQQSTIINESGPSAWHVVAVVGG